MRNLDYTDNRATYIEETPQQITFGVYRHNFTCRNQACGHRCRIAFTSRSKTHSVEQGMLDARFSSLCNMLVREAVVFNGSPAGQKTLTSLVDEVK